MLYFFLSRSFHVYDSIRDRRNEEQLVGIYAEQENTKAG